MTPAEKKSVVFEVAGWIWGTIQGTFNEQQSTSQLIVDAVIGMIPVVGDVTAVRDLLAVTLRLAESPEKRKEKAEWLLLVVLLFALIPVAGGIIKGVGRSLLKVGTEVAEHAKVLREMVELLNRLGHGNAVKFIKELSVEKYAPELLGQWRRLMQRLDTSIGACLNKLRSVLPDAMVERLVALRAAFKELAAIGERMIPEAVKELGRRLKTVQSAVYKGEWHDVSTLAAGKAKSATRELEARVVMEADSKGMLKPTWKGGVPSSAEHEE